MTSACFYVYLIHNTVNNKVYVGKTKNLKLRRFKHLSDSKSKTTNQYIHKAIRKYVSLNFTFSTIQTLSNEQDCNEAEKYWIRYYNSKNPLYGYNLTDGGDGSKGRVQTIVTREKISLRNKGKLAGNKNPFYGKKHTKEQISSISAKNTGLKRTYACRKQKSESMLGDRNHFYGKKHSECVVSNMSGEKSTSAKLNAQQVCNIVELYKSELYTQKQLALMFNISQTQISRIVNCKRWKEILEIK